MKECSNSIRSPPRKRWLESRLFKCPSFEYLFKIWNLYKSMAATTTTRNRYRYRSYVAVMRIFSLQKLLIWSSSIILILCVLRFYIEYNNDDNGLMESVSTMTNHSSLSMARLSNKNEIIGNGISDNFLAGMYMAGQRPKNKSSCNWYHGLPQSLSYSPSKIAFTPEIGKNSPYRVLPYVVRARETSKELPNITLCTHATADQVYGIVELAKRWEGRISIAVFAPGPDAGIAVTLLDRACRCETAMSKVSIHLVFPMDQPPILGQMKPTNGDCTAIDLQWIGIENERKKRAMIYPVNVVRNVARTEATTTRVLVSDIELLPSKKLASNFLAMLDGRSPQIQVVFVIPVFEIAANQRPPSTKQELLLAIKDGLAVYFHRFLCPHCQKFPGLARWTARPDPGKILPLIITKREYPHHRWEPIFIGTREDPFYAEDMSWEGRQDKMTQMLEMCLRNYRFVVLDGAFFVHTPGIKRKSYNNVNYIREESLRSHQRRNAKIYQRIVKHLLERYPDDRKICIR